MSREQEVKTHQPRRRGPMGHGMQPGEKPKDFKKSIKKLMSYISENTKLQFLLSCFLQHVLPYLMLQDRKF